MLVVQDPHRLAEHPAIDAGDEVEALGDRQERARRDEIAVVVGVAQQQLEPGHRVLAEREDRLGEQAEAIVGDSGAQPFQPGRTDVDRLA